MTIRKIAALAALTTVAAAIGAVSTASAATGGQDTVAVHAVTVFYRDLNLARPEGLAALRGRIGAAARSVCGPLERDLRAEFARRTCMKQAVVRATRDVSGAPVLTAGLH